MAGIRRILVSLDMYKDHRDERETRPPEVEKAVRLIDDKAGGRVCLVGCGIEDFLRDSYPWLGPDAVDQRKACVAAMGRRLDGFADALRGDGCEVEVRTHLTHPRYEQIAADAAELGADLVVQHAHARGMADRHSLSHDSWELVRLCPAPVLLTREAPWPGNPVILAAVDPVRGHNKPEGLDRRILEAALRMKRRLGGRVHVAHACPREGAKEKHRKALDGLLSGYDLPDDAAHLIDGPPAMAILRCREELSADIVVMGALSRSRLKEAIIGHTAARTLDYVAADLLIVKPG